MGGGVFCLDGAGGPACPWRIVCLAGENGKCHQLGNLPRTARMDRLSLAEKRLLRRACCGSLLGIYLKGYLIGGIKYLGTLCEGVDEAHGPSVWRLLQQQRAKNHQLGSLLWAARVGVFSLKRNACWTEPLAGFYLALSREAT